MYETITLSQLMDMDDRKRGRDAAKMADLLAACEKLLAKVESEIPYRADGDVTDRENWEIVSLARAAIIAARSEE